MKKIKILIPIYNDWQSVFKLLEDINSNVSNIDHEISVIIVNDASTETRPNDNLKFKELSMGMSDDYEIAIKCGATHIRLGTFFFGKRKY